MKVTGGQLIPLEKKSKYRCTHWKLRVPIGINPRTGKYTSRNKNFRGTYAEAVEAHAEFRREVTNEKRIGKVDLTFKELCEKYIDYKLTLGKISIYTARKQQGHLNLFIMHLGNAKANKIQPFMIVDAIKGLKNGDSPSGKAASGTYLNKAISLCRAAYSYGIEEGFIAENPFEKIEKPSIDTKEKKALTDKQITTLLNLNQTERQNIMLSIAIFTGLRRGEISALQWGNIDFDKGVINIVASMKEDGFIKDTKTKASAAIVPIADELVERLKQWKLTQYEQMSTIGIAQTNETFVLANRFGEPWKPGMITRWWDNNRNKYSCNGISFHQLRHTFITYLAMCDVHPSVMQSLARHATEDMTLGVYTHVNNEQERVAINALNREFSSKIRT